MPPTSVFRSKQPLLLTLQPELVLELLPGKPPSLAPAWPYIKSISRPSTALTRPTSNVKSGRNRVRAYHSRSLPRVKAPAWMAQVSAWGRALSAGDWTPGRDPRAYAGTRVPTDCTFGVEPAAAGTGRVNGLV